MNSSDQRCRSLTRPVRFLLFGMLLVLRAPVHGRTMVPMPAIDTRLVFAPPANHVVVAKGAMENTSLEPIDAQISPRGAGNRDPHLRIDAPRDGAVVAPGELMQVTVSSPDRTRFVGITIVMDDPIEFDEKATSLQAHFSIKIPKSIASGFTTVSAMGGRAGGQFVVAMIDVDID